MLITRKYEFISKLFCKYNIAEKKLVKRQGELTRTAAPVRVKSVVVT